MKTAQKAIARLAPLWFLVACGCVLQDKGKVATASAARDTVAEAVLGILRTVPYRSGPLLAEALQEIESFGPLAVPPLERGLLHERAEVRAFSAYALGRLGDPAAIRPLKERESDPEPPVRYESAIARVALGDWTSVPILIAGLRDPDRVFRFKCFEVLSQATGLSFGYDFAGSPERRNEAAERWKEWWDKVPQIAAPVE